jgi:hypothetical protein
MSFIVYSIISVYWTYNCIFGERNLWWYAINIEVLFIFILLLVVGMLMALFVLVVTLKWLIGLQISIGCENSDETTK